MILSFGVLSFLQGCSVQGIRLLAVAVATWYNCSPRQGRKEEKKVLLKRDAVPQILELYGLPEPAASDMYRAIEQASSRLRKGIYT